MKLLKPLKSCYRSVDRIYCMFFLMGIMIGLLFYFKTEDNYERNLFSALSRNVSQNSKNSNDSSALLLNSLHVVHNAIKSRHEFFNDIKGFKAEVLQPVTVDLMTGQGACGSYALVMARLVKELGFNARIAQMKVGDTFGGHHIIEASYNNTWVVVDPLYNVYFIKPDGSLASFKDVQSNWEYYKQQLPAGYDMSYSYEDVRYTNWDKIPVLMPALKKTLDLVIGKQRADEVSIRFLMLRKLNVFYNVLLGMFFYY
ncbi:MAG: hypothetical protein KF862_20450 [Chitinophagaceae bacterium]|nr:hypothetical protein [Chitinophagaceae bacterium]